MNKILAIFFSLHFIFLGALTAVAQEYDEDGFLINQTIEDAESDTASVVIGSSQVAGTIDEKNVKEGELASCFDYYKFGSVGVNLTADFDAYQGGDVVMLSGTIENSNEYPLTGLDIKARMIKDIPEADYDRSEILILDEFDVATDISIGALGNHKVLYSYQLPQNAPSGDYKILFYASEQDRFNMSGLSFTNDIVASQIAFEVSGEMPDHTYLDQTQIVVGGQPHNVMAFMTRHEKGEIPVSIPLYNSDADQKEMRITYILYSWDGINPENVIDTKVEEVMVEGKSEKILNYVIQDALLPVYYLNIVAEPTERTRDKSVFSEKTISNIRLAVNGYSKPRLNFVGITAYPIKAGQEATLVTCFHNTTDMQNSDVTRIETVLSDQNGRVLARTEYEGPTVSDITGVVKKFTPRYGVSELSLVSTMYDTSGNVIDRIEKTYSCEDIDLSLCGASGKIPMPLLAGVGAVLIVLLAFVFYKRKAFNDLRV